MNHHDQPLWSSPSRRDFLTQSGECLAGAVRLGAIWREVTPPRTTPSRSPWSVAADGAPAPRASAMRPRGLPSSGPWPISSVAGCNPASKTSPRSLPSRSSVPKERQFVGLDGYKKAIDSLGPGDVVILATPPAFRPIHFEYAVEKGLNVFMEKSFAVDAPGHPPRAQGRARRPRRRTSRSPAG